jgi:hypothetical protein
MRRSDTVVALALGLVVPPLLRSGLDLERVRSASRF